MAKEWITFHGKKILVEVKHKRGNKLLSSNDAKRYDSEKRCDIVRFYRDENKRSRIIKRDVPESVARLHCNDPKTKKDGVYFDGFRYR